MLQKWLTPIIACLALVILLWVPFGLKVSGIMEEWLVIHSVEIGGQSDRDENYSLFITQGTQRTRPLVGVAPILGYSLTPDSFVGFNLVAMALFFAKGLVLYSILCRLAPKNRPYALLVALLFVIYPADSGLFTFRAISIHLSVLLYLLGVYFFLIYFQHGRWWGLVGAWLAVIGSVWIYEVAYPLIVLMPLLLIWQEGRLNRRVIRDSLMWYLAPLLALLYITFIFIQGASYQSWLLQHSGLNQPSVFVDMLTSLGSAYYRHFVGGWGQALTQLQSPYVGLSLLMVVIALIAGALVTRGGSRLDGDKRRYWLLALIGFLLVGLGYAPYLVTPYRQLDWRVYYYSSFGGAICVGSVVYLLVLYTRSRIMVFVPLMSLLIGLGTLRALNQHEYYNELALTQQQLLHGVVAQVPRLKSEVPIVVVDETGTYNSNWSLGASYLLRYALDYVYSDNRLTAVLCSFDPSTGQFVILPEVVEQCAFAPDGLKLTQGDTQINAYPYDQMVLIRYTKTGAQLLESIPPTYLHVPAQERYNPLRFVDQEAAPPRRFFTLFSLTG